MITRTDQKKGECEVCDKVDVQLTLHYGNMWFCDDCWKLEQKLSAENQSPEKQAERVQKVNDVVLETKKVNSQVELREDIYNATTLAIVELQKQIAGDASITNKTFALAEAVTELKGNFSKLIFDKQSEITELRVKERAAQSILNQLANQLHQTERDQLKLKDKSYQPKAPKTIKHAEPKIGTQKFKLEEVKKWAEKYGLPAPAIQAVVVQRKITPEEAAKVLAKMMGKAI